MKNLLKLTAMAAGLFVGAFAFAQGSPDSVSGSPASAGTPDGISANPTLQNQGRIARDRSNPASMNKRYGNPAASAAASGAAATDSKTPGTGTGSSRPSGTVSPPTLPNAAPTGSTGPGNQ